MPRPDTRGHHTLAAGEHVEHVALEPVPVSRQPSTGLEPGCCRARTSARRPGSPTRVRQRQLGSEHSAFARDQLIAEHHHVQGGLELGRVQPVGLRHLAITGGAGAPGNGAWRAPVYVRFVPVVAHQVGRDRSHRFMLNGSTAPRQPGSAPTPHDGARSCCSTRAPRKPRYRSGWPRRRSAPSSSSRRSHGSPSDVLPQ